MDPKRRLKDADVTILLVDDQPVTETLIRRMLEHEPSLKLHYCRDPRKAVETAIEIEPGLVLLDMVMPEMDGLEVLRQFRGPSGMRRVPIIMLTHHDQPQLKAQAFSNGANDYLIKLPDQEEMLARLRYHAGLFMARGQHREMESRLRASEEKYRNLFQYSQDAIFIIQAATGNIIDANRAACQLLQKEGGELIGRSHLDLYPPEQADGYAALLVKRTHQSGRFNREFLVARADGTTAPVEVSTSDFVLQGEPLIQAIFRDVSERKRTESTLFKALHLLGESEGQLQAILDNAEALFFLKDLEGRFILVNKAFEDLFQVAKQWVRGRTVDELFSGEDAVSLAEGDKEVVEEQRHLHKEVTFSREGESRAYLSMRFPLVDVTGEAYAVCGIFTDISHLKKVEADLRQSRDGLNQAQEIARLGSWEWSFDSDEVTWSDETYRIFGFDRDETRADFDALLSRIHPEERESVRERLSKVKEDPSVCYDNQCRLLLPDGTERTLHTLGRVEVDESGRPVRFLGTIQDVTERMAMEAELRRHRDNLDQLVKEGAADLEKAYRNLKTKQQEIEALNATLEERVVEAVTENREKDAILVQQTRMAAMGEMIGNIAHQWRQPINALNLVLANINDSYQMGVLKPEEMTRQMEKGQEIIQAMSTTIEDFRGFFKPRRAKETFSLADRTRNAMRLVESSFAASGVALDFSPDEPGPAGVGFPNEFSQVVLVMLVNAKDAILANRREGGRVTIALGEEGENAVATIRDNGGGIQPEHLDKIFDPYFTTKESGAGVGIGLYMAKLIIEQHMGGRIEVENLEEGAAFRIYTPKARV